MHGLTEFVAKDFIIIPVLVTVYLFWKLGNKDRKKLAALIALAGVLSLAFAKIGSYVYSDPRPFIKDHVTPYFNASDYNGFPSDHTLLASLLGFVVLIYWRRVGYALLVLAALIGWARVAAGVHHAVDIIGSFLFTGLATFIAFRALERWHAGKETKKSKRSV